LDNLTHTLVGACLAESGLKRRTALGAATLMIGANFPDIDVVAVPLGVGLEWRRGITHGFLALAVLPFVLAGIMLLWDKHVRRRRDPGAVPAVYSQLVVLAGVAIATHPTLDFMNTYGMRWLMPFQDRWYYADGLFIVDFWLLVALAMGYVWSRRARSPIPARGALVFLTAYTMLMLSVTGLVRQRVAAGFPGHPMLVEPNPIVPWGRDVLLEDSAGYRFGRASLVGPIWIAPQLTPKLDTGVVVARARELPEVRRFLRWARFPMYRVSEKGGRMTVWVGDARYDGADWASISVTLP
jgi:inner membrane protein